MTVSNNFLPFKDFHIVKIGSISPDEIKKSAYKTVKDHTDIKHNTILNYIAKSLGVKGGFAGYKNTYQEQILPFMHKHGLTKHSDLLTLREPGFDCGHLELSRQCLSDRLFKSEYNLPERVFTGYNFNYKETMDGGSYSYRHTMDQLADTIPGIPAFKPRNDVISRFHEMNDEKVITNTIDAIKAYGDSYLITDCEGRVRELRDTILAFYTIRISSGFNLLGDTLVSPQNLNHQVQLYSKDINSNDHKSDLKGANKLLTYFRNRIDEQNDGWVSILPFNDKLIFIRGDNGEYDLLFKNARSHSFKHQIFGNKLHICDVPFFIDDYDYDRWNYFKNNCWNEKEEHDAENAYYKSIGKGDSYLGLKSIVQNHYIRNGNYSLRQVDNSKPQSVPLSFHHEVAGNQNILVSNPVSISDFNTFLSSHQYYLKYRVGDNIHNVNYDSNIELPVSCTWFDALGNLRISPSHEIMTF